MAEQTIIPLTDDELQAVADKPDLVAKLTSEERRRLDSLSPPEPSMLRRAGQSVMDTARGARKLITDHPAAAGALGLGTAMSVATGGLAAPAAMGLVGLAGAGGAGAGLAASQYANRDTAPAPTVAGNVGQMASQGAQMAAGEGIGRGVVAGAQSGAKWLMNRGMNNMASRLSNEFPNISQDMIDHAISVSQGGYDKAKLLLQGAKATANATVSTADQAGAKIPVKVATDAMATVSDRIANSGNIEGNFKALTKTVNQLTAGRSADLTIAEADALKTSLNSEAQSLLKQYQMAGVRGLPALKVEAEAKLAAARALNDAIEQATSQAGAPGYQAANKSAQSMIGITRGLKTALRGSQNNYQALVRPGMGALTGGAVGEREGHPFLGAAAGAALGSPAGMSRSAILLGNPAVQAVLQRLPAPLIQAVTEALNSTPTPPE